MKRLTLCCRRHAATRRRPRTALRFAACTLIAGLAFGTPAAAESFAFTDGALIEAVAADGGWVVRSAGAETPLPFDGGADVHVQQLAATTSGWLLSATSLRDHRSRLVVMQRSGTGDAVALPVPQTSGRVLLQPTVLADADRRGPATLLWIEGDSARESSVRAAAWNGAGWDDTVVLSPRGAGTQIALDALRLADGGLLATWSAFDGDDDEVVWSHSKDGTTWSEPLPLSENNVPDVTPALALVDGGAVVAWSGYDGNDYRVWTARFDGERWSDARRHGERGSVFPSFADPAAERPLLIYKQTAPSAWRISRLDGEGAESRTLSLELSKQRPLVLGSDDEGVSLRGAAEKSAATRRVSWAQ
ncbi:MAG: hypothetical protein AAGM22_05560 [Acidobacteriota bacterium]